VYVLYQRLLQVLGKKQRSKQYARVGEELALENGVLKMQVTLDQPMTIKLSVHTSAGEQVLAVDEQSREIGTHSIEVRVDTLKADRYYLQMQTPAETYSRYFELT
ncbi:MAG: hypothetical protein ACKOSR_04015, partial [Flavobacteriales bacterium]